MSVTNPIRIGSHVYLRNAIVGEPGCVMGIDRRGRAEVYWPDLPELGRNTFHSIDSLEVDSGFMVSQIALDFEEIAA